MSHSEVVIIGAGPYGLSIAAHLKAYDVDFRIFGHPMHTWRTHMPKGMYLKSEGFASSLSEPGSTFTLEAYCREKGLPYSHTNLPVPLEVFSSYGIEFQQRFVGALEQHQVESVQRSPEGFRIRLEDGEIISARRVVVASGLANYEYTPPTLAALPKEFVTHSSRHHELDHFRGREVAIVGAGASALDLAALLHQSGAHVQVIARRSTIRFHDPPEAKKVSWLRRLRAPITGIGPGWQLYFYANAPLLFRRMPQQFRLNKVRQILGPAPCWFVKQQVIGKVPLHVGMNIREAKVQNGRVHLQAIDASGSERTFETEYVIAATGYKVDLNRLVFIDSDLQSAIKSVNRSPVLSSNFESTVPGLYFVGVSAANTFGPLLRFAFGADFAARRLSRHLVKSAKPKQSSESLIDSETPSETEIAVR